MTTKNRGLSISEEGFNGSVSILRSTAVPYIIDIKHCFESGFGWFEAHNISGQTPGMLSDCFDHPYLRALNNDLGESLAWLTRSTTIKYTGEIHPNRPIIYKTIYCAGQPAKENTKGIVSKAHTAGVLMQGNDLLASTRGFFLGIDSDLSVKERVKKALEKAQRAEETFRYLSTEEEISSVLQTRPGSNEDRLLEMDIASDRIKLQNSKNMIHGAILTMFAHSFIEPKSGLVVETDIKRQPEGNIIYLVSGQETRKKRGWQEAKASLYYEVRDEKKRKEGEVRTPVVRVDTYIEKPNFPIQ